MPACGEDLLQELCKPRIRADHFLEESLDPAPDSAFLGNRRPIQVPVAPFVGREPLLEQRIAKLEERKRRLVQAYVYDQAIDQEIYSRELTKISEDLTLVKVEHHGNEIDTFGVEAVLEFAEYVVLNARRLWEEFPLELRRRVQKVLFPDSPLRSELEPPPEIRS